jgi:tRNA(Ile)-lysidine synthetase-like protein
VLFVLHLNHNLRGPESESDAAFVAELASRLSLEAAIETEDVASLAARLHLSLEAAGRSARYAFFQRAAATHRLDCIATAHTRDDQAETVLLRLLRGAGTSGLAGIHRSFDLSQLAPEPLTPESLASQSLASKAADAALQSPRLIRPLLFISRQQVEAFLRGLGQPFRHDASNLDPSFLRNRVRNELLPGLERDYNPRLRQALAETAEIAAAEDAFLDNLASSVLGADLLGLELRPEAKIEPGVEVSLLRAQPLALQRRILRRLCRPYGLALDFAQIEALREFSLAGRAGRLNLPRGFAAEVVRKKLLPPRLSLLAPRPTRPAAYCLELTVPGTVRLAEFWDGQDMYIRAVMLEGGSEATAYNCLSFLSPARAGSSLTIRNLCPGDRFHPLHTSGERKVNRLLQELSIPSALRRRWPVAMTGERIVWVPGLPVADDFAWTPGEGEAVVLQLRNEEGTLVYG